LKPKNNVLYHLSLSFFAAVLILILAFYGSSDNISISFYDRMLVVGFFIIICIFGISLSFFPGWYKRFIKNKDHGSKNKKFQKMSRRRKGHHPDCDSFISHVLKFNSKTYCAGCFGLAIGLVLSIFLGIIYLFYIDKILINFNYLIFVGLILIFLGFLETIKPIKNAIIHIIANVFLIIGFFLIVVGMFETTDNMVYMVISVIFSFLFLDTRVQISSFNHNIICRNCKEKCKMY
jgi:hypothetical protein